MKMSDIKININEEYARLVPEISRQEYEAFKLDIKERGLLVPITVNSQGVILDGHHRYRACLELGVECSFVIKDFESELLEKLFVININLKRRHLSTFQRIELALKEKPILEELATKNSQANLKQNHSNVHVHSISKLPLPSVEYQTVGEGNDGGRVDQQIGDRAGVGKDTVRKVEYILKRAPQELVDRLRRRSNETRNITIHTVYKMLYNEQIREELVRNAKPTIELPNNIKLIHSDFRDYIREIPESSIDHIFTDPPYGKSFLHLYKDVASAANRILKPGGSLVVYCNQFYLDKIMADIIDAGLTYWWTFAIVYSNRGTKPVYERHVLYGWKPFLWFVKGDKLPEGTQYIEDLIDKKSVLNKELHDWAQDPIEAEHVISKLTLPNQIVMDPMMGSGTTGIAAIKLRRKFIGIENNPRTFEIAKANVNLANAS